ncbi:MAG: lamin tail domain-containing protein, partial [Chloroflexi bacterium]|nr:lamin tail domain-containing protein [Chloroflexota bacterium]
MQSKSYLKLIVFILLFLFLAVPAGRAGAANPPGPGEVLINEYVANSAVTEWVELYNITNSPRDLSGHTIDDIAGGGGAPKVIPNGTIIAAHGYYVMEFQSFLNNTGDDVRFLDPAQATLDSTSYGSATAEYSRYRFPDGGAWSGIESSSPTKGASNGGTGDEPWTPGTFEVRIFDVEQGDSQLIIFPSGFSILIDVREASWNTGAGAAFIAQKIRAITGGSHVNVGVLSHLHLDHIGYAGFGGFWGLLENEGITFDQIIDRDAGTWLDGSGGGASDGLCDPDLEIVWHNAGTQSGTARNWLCYATNP